MAIWDRKNQLYWTGSQWDPDPRKASLYASSSDAWGSLPYGIDRNYLMTVDEDEDNFWND